MDVVGQVLGTIDLEKDHPDECCGLKQVGNIGLRNGVVVLLCGIDAVLLLAVGIIYLDNTGLMFGLMLSAALAVLILGPTSIFLPLWPFRKVMKKLRQDRIRAAEDKRNMLKENHGSRDAIRAAGKELRDAKGIPVWPFDKNTVRLVGVLMGFPATGFWWLYEPTVIEFLRAWLIG